MSQNINGGDDESIKAKNSEKAIQCKFEQEWSWFDPTKKRNSFPLFNIDHFTPFSFTKEIWKLILESSVYNRINHLLTMPSKSFGRLFRMFFVTMGKRCVVSKDDWDLSDEWLSQILSSKRVPEEIFRTSRRHICSDKLFTEQFRTISQFDK